VRELFDYDPLTGILKWRASARRRGGKHKAGDVAGSDDSKGYFQVCADYRVMRLHRVIWCWMTGAWPSSGLAVDHADGNGKNNVWANLRLATHSQNMANSRLRSTNTTGMKGVYYDKIRRKWYAYVRVEFPSAQEARAAYRKIATAAFGEFARFA